MIEKDFLDPSEGIFKYTTEGIFIVNESGTIIRANPSSEKMFGYTDSTLVGKKIEDLIPTRYKAGHAGHRQKFHGEARARSMGWGMDLYGLRQDGSEIPVEISLSPYSDGTAKFVIAFIIDISIRKEQEQKLIDYKNELEKEVEERTLDLRNTIQSLEKTKNDLDKALTREQELSSMKSRFVSIASHEFRTPLATILSSLSLVEKYGNLKEDEKRDKHIQRIKNSVRNLTEILNDFLSLNRLEEGKVIALAEKFSLSEVLDEVYHQMLTLTKKDQILELCIEGPKMFTSDPKLITNIIINLLSNAIKFSPDGGKIWITSSLKEKQLILKVKDQGIGIPKEEHKHVFERFYRMSNAGEVQGTGLGLSIVCHYVNLLKGSITFESALGEGTEFTVTIPASE